MPKKPLADVDFSNLTVEEEDKPQFKRNTAPNPFEEHLAKNYAINKNLAKDEWKGMRVDIPVPPDADPDDVGLTVKNKVRNAAQILGASVRTSHEVSKDGKKIRVHFMAFPKRERKPRENKPKPTESVNDQGGKSSGKSGKPAA